MGKLVDLVGMKYHRLTVVSRAPNKRTSSAWNCVCECGGEVVVTGTDLRNGHTKSCGCFRKETTRATRRKHGATGTPTYEAWKSMKKRCSNQENSDFPSYGGRGIQVCERWINSFPNFLEDMGERPENKSSIDRINNNGNYEPENCRWSTQKEQCNNKRNNVLLTHNGKTQSLTLWAEELGCTKSVLRARKSRTWSDEKTLSTPF